MELVVREENGVFEICDGLVKKMTPQMFIKKYLVAGIFKDYSDGITIFMSQLNLWGCAILYSLKSQNMTDITKGLLEANSAAKPKEAQYSYVLGAKAATWFSISYNIGGRAVMIYAYENLVPLNEEEIMADFGQEGCEPVAAMYNALQELRRLGCEMPTISSSAYHMWKHTCCKYDYSKLFPEFSEEEYKFLKYAHHGGLCFVNREGKCGNGIILDVNSLYPAMMKNKLFPVRKGEKFVGEIPKICKDKRMLYFVHFKCRFHVKDDYIPFVRTNGSDWKYSPNDILITSDIYDSNTGEWYDEYVDNYGEIHPATCELYMFKPEFELFLEHYYVDELEIIDGYRFFGAYGVFDLYLKRLIEMKENAKTPSERRIAKMLMNALSGNLAKNKYRESVYFEEQGLESIMKLGEYHAKEHTTGCRNLSKDRWGHRRYVDLSFEEICAQVSGRIETESRSQSHIAMGAAITSYGMVEIVKAAQANYEHFLYTDTDSLHLDCSLDEVKGVEIDDKKLGAFKVEHTFLDAYYVQPKVYYFHGGNGEITVKWSGMRDSSRQLLEKCILSIKTDSFDNPFMDIDWIKPEELTDFSWTDYMNAVKRGSEAVNIWIPYATYEVMNLETLEKRRVVGAYNVDISRFL